MASINPTRIELQNRFFLSAPRVVRKATFWALVLFVVLVVATASTLNRVFPLEEIDWQEVARRARKPLAYDVWDLILFTTVVLASLAHLVYHRRARRLERMILTESEIRYQSALPRALQFLMPGWSAKWNDITRAYFRKKRGAYGPGSIELVLATYRGEEHRLRPYLWVDTAESEPQSSRQALRQVQSIKPPELRRAILESPIVRFVAARLPRFETEAGWDKVAFPYALETNRRALVALALCATLMAYAITDLVINQETYASRPPYSTFALLGVIVALIAGRWLSGADMPSAERAGLAIVLGATFAAALYPGLLRINQLTGGVGLQTYLYQLQRDGSLAPLQTGPPELRFLRYADYWSSFSAGSLHEFRLRRGGLGFYQVDMAPINEAMRKYFRKQP
jgi:hypothetical protein